MQHAQPATPPPRQQAGVGRLMVGAHRNRKLFTLKCFLQQQHDDVHGSIVQLNTSPVHHGRSSDPRTICFMSISSIDDVSAALVSLMVIKRETDKGENNIKRLKMVTRYKNDRDDDVEINCKRYINKYV